MKFISYGKIEFMFQINDSYIQGMESHILFSFIFHFINLSTIHNWLFIHTCSNKATGYSNKLLFEMYLNFLKSAFMLAKYFPLSIILFLSRASFVIF